MTFYDIFNGDADGICALLQLRRVEPRDSILVTGVKRDIRLLQKINAQTGDELTVLDISLKENRPDLESLLARGARVHYFDHHVAGEIPRHPGFFANIDTAPDVCTSLLVDRHLGGSQRAWAVVAAFGDNLHESAKRAAVPLELNEKQLTQLRDLGECLNYNAYGESVEDLYYHPADLYQRLKSCRSPLEFIESDSAFGVLQNGYRVDLQRALGVTPGTSSPACAVFQLPDAAWSRRVAGVFGNHLAHAFPQRAHAVLTPLSKGGHSVSVRAPIAHPEGADELCRQFGGSGRKTAAGINHLSEAEIANFIAKFSQKFATPR
jgi:hypothetical protein